MRAFVISGMAFCGLAFDALVVFFLVAAFATSAPGFVVVSLFIVGVGFTLAVAAAITGVCLT